jgi:hypothetical protein
MLVNCSIGTVAVRVTSALLDPPWDWGLLKPEPEPFMGISVIVSDGFSTVEPWKVTSGSMRQTNPKFCPSSMSNSADSM